VALGLIGRKSIKRSRFGAPLSRGVHLDHTNWDSPGIQIGVESSSLVKIPTKLNVSRGSRWSPKARRWFQRLLSGVTHHQANRRRLRVMTLTTSPRGRACARDINSSFQVLKQRVKRKWPGAKFEYWKLRTSEGNGVLHIIYLGPWIPQSWLSRTWGDIHYSPIVYILSLIHI